MPQILLDNDSDAGLNIAIKTTFDGAGAKAAADSMAAIPENLQGLKKVGAGMEEIGEKTHISNRELRVLTSQLGHGIPGAAELMRAGVEKGAGGVFLLIAGIEMLRSAVEKINKENEESAAIGKELESTDQDRAIRGYCGRDERRDCPDATKRAMDEFQSPKFRRESHPGELFLSFDEWHNQLGQVIDRYNAASQDGKVLNGLSPDEAFEKCWPHNNPPTRLDASSWHLVAHYVRPVPVNTNGICFRIGSKSFVYRNERTGHERGKTVLAWFDPDCPEFLCVTDMNRQNPYLVERADAVDFLAEPGDPVFEREIAKAASHSAYPRARFNVLKAKFASTYRRNIVDVETAETAQEFNRLRTDKQAEQKQVSAETGRARKSFSRIGMTSPRKLRPGQSESAQRLAEILADEKSIKTEESK